MFADTVDGIVMTLNTKFDSEVNDSINFRVYPELLLLLLFLLTMNVIATLESVELKVALN